MRPNQGNTEFCPYNLDVNVRFPYPRLYKKEETKFTYYILVVLTSLFNGQKYLKHHHYFKLFTATFHKQTKNY